MERLTFSGNFCDIAQCLEIHGGKHCLDGYCSRRRIWERLKEYEDTWLGPDEFRESVDFTLNLNKELRRLGSIEHLRGLVQAEQDGRLVVLPCKVGDTVWFKTYSKNATACLGIHPHEVVRFDISAVVPGEHTDTELPLYEFGKSVFLTREESEAVLEKTKEGY